MPETVLRRKQTYQNIAWFLDLKNRGLLEMDPPYQRWSVWNLDYKQRFVETLLLAYPSPAIFLFRRVDETGKTLYEVVDGKQRLLAIFEFLDNEFAVKEDSPLVSQRGKYFQGLDKAEKISFFDYDLSVEYLPTNNETVINDIFDRLNRNTAKLTAQELRHAKYNGDFITAAERLANWTWGFGTPAEDNTDDGSSTPKVPRLPADMPRMGTQSRRQMKDVEIVSTLLLYLEEGVRGYSSKDVDKAFSDREEWEREEEIVEEYRQVIGSLSDLAHHPDGRFMLQSRIRNQADFYSFFAVVADLLREKQKPQDDELLRRLAGFLDKVERAGDAAPPPYVLRYYDAARSASNDVGPRTTRIRIMKKVLLGQNLDEHEA
ncbi:MAG: DUF262 domain-containing protein [Planctomycetaceae bacterium]